MGRGVPSLKGNWCHGRHPVGHYLIPDAKAVLPASPTAPESSRDFQTKRQNIIQPKLSQSLLSALRGQPLSSDPCPHLPRIYTADFRDQRIWNLAHGSAEAVDRREEFISHTMESSSKENFHWDANLPSFPCTKETHFLRTKLTQTDTQHSNHLFVKVQLNRDVFSPLGKLLHISKEQCMKSEPYSGFVYPWDIQAKNKCNLTF